jgi:cell wall-associated NlpC family hydrolase
VSDLAAVVNRLIGTPWQRGGFDCWELVRVAYCATYQIHLPRVPVDGGNVLASASAVDAGRHGPDWRQVAAPGDGDLVIMGLTTRPHHVGLWLAQAPAIVAHCDQRGGTVAQTMRQMRAAGWSGFLFYRHRDRP